jgi:hypothetical protein
MKKNSINRFCNLVVEIDKQSKWLELQKISYDSIHSNRHEKSFEELYANELLDLEILHDEFQYLFTTRNI